MLLRNPCFLKGNVQIWENKWPHKNFTFLMERYPNVSSCLKIACDYIKNQQNGMVLKQNYVMWRNPQNQAEYGHTVVYLWMFSAV